MMAQFELLKSIGIAREFHRLVTVPPRSTGSGSAGITSTTTGTVRLDALITGVGHGLRRIELRLPQCRLRLTVAGTTVSRHPGGNSYVHTQWYPGTHCDSQARA
eukprot:3631887-Rhodomonas_salina.1